LGSLRVFVAVADHLNFTRAADALGVTASAASLQIRALEGYLARPLFRRNGRQVHLTSEGACLLPRVQQALTDIERAVDDVRGERQSGPVKVTTLSSFLQQWLLPRMARFRAAHPEVALHLQSSPNAVDFVREDFHLAIRFGTGGWPNVRAEKLLEEWLLPVCAPALYKKYGPVRNVDDLRRYPLLHSVSEPWTTWMFDGRADDPSAGFRGALYDDSQAVVRLAVQGDGLALGRWCLVADDVGSGALVAAGDRPVRFERSYWVVWPNRAHEVPGVKAFISWLRIEAAAFPAPSSAPAA
jgi:LysR family glycine cleavage system transcriptional activator